jgi:hypothetical protein
VNLEIKEAISVFEFVCFNYAHFDQSRMEWRIKFFSTYAIIFAFDLFRRNFLILVQITLKTVFAIRIIHLKWL